MQLEPTSDYVANVMYLKNVKKTSMSSFGIINAIDNRFGYEILYDMVWRAKQKVLEKRFDTYNDLYQNLPSLLEVIQGRNSGTCIATHNFVNLYVD